MDYIKIYEERNKEWQQAIEEGRVDPYLYPFFYYLAERLFNATFDIYKQYNLSEQQREELYSKIISVEFFPEFISYLEWVGNFKDGLEDTVKNYAKKFYGENTNWRDWDLDEIDYNCDEFSIIPDFKNNYYTYYHPIRAVYETDNNCLTDICIWNGENGFIEKYIGSDQEIDNDLYKTMKQDWFYNIYYFFWHESEYYGVRMNYFAPLFIQYAKFVASELSVSNEEWLAGFKDRKERALEFINKDKELIKMTVEILDPNKKKTYDNITVELSIFGKTITGKRTQWYFFVLFDLLNYHTKYDFNLYLGDSFDLLNKIRKDCMHSENMLTLISRMRFYYLQVPSHKPTAENLEAVSVVFNLPKDETALKKYLEDNYEYLSNLFPPTMEEKAILEEIQKEKED